jgi:ABC-2 type transport system permease protein
MGYGVLWALLRAAILGTVGIALGAPLFGVALLPAVGILAVTMLAYAGIGLMIAACILVFRTAGPIAPIMLTASMFLGGVYYPTRVIPSWLRDVGESLPLTWGLRALRQVLLRDAPLSTVAWDVIVLVMMTLVLLIAGSVAFILALRRARRAGTLSTY